ncbi:hypothetical protein D3C72_2373760 [compost metagenome]
MFSPQILDHLPIGHVRRELTGMDVRFDQVRGNLIPDPRIELMEVLPESRDVDPFLQQCLS